MKKIPWGIMAGACAIAAFFTVVATIALYVIFGGIAAMTNATASLFDEWYQVLLFVAAVISVLGLIGTTVMYFVTAKRKKEKGEKEA